MNNTEASTPPNFNPHAEFLALRNKVAEHDTALNLAYALLERLAGGKEALHGLLNTDKCPT